VGTSIAQFSGLASGVQWRDLVDQLVAVEERRSVRPIVDQIDLETRRRGAWQRFGDTLSGFGTAAGKLRTLNGFVSNKATVPASPTSNRALFALTAAATATPGSYQVEVQTLAANQKLGGATVASATTALGYSGTFSINGRDVAVAADDTLTTLRNKINAVNTGTNASKVSASLVTTGPNANRLVLTSEATGEAGIAIGDASGVAADLGFTTQRSRTVSSATMAFAAAIGVSVPEPSTIEVNGRIIAVNLEMDSLTALAARIQAAGVDAEVVSEQNGSGSAFRLQVGGSVRAVSGDADSAATVALLGLASAGPRAVRQQVAAPTPFTAGGSAASNSTLLTDLETNGTSAGLVVGDALNFSGRRGDGSIVTVGVTVAADTTLGDVLNRINNTTDGFGFGSRAARAQLDADGTLRVVDQTGGDSRLAFSMQRMSAATGTASDVVTGAVEVSGRQRQLAAGSDARVVIDGTTVSRASNTFSDVIPGLTFALQQAEPGTTLTATVAKDTDAQVATVRGFVKAYNDVMAFTNGQRQDGQPLDNNGTLRSALSSLTAALRTPSSGTGDWTSLAVAGVTLDREGRLQLDEPRMRRALEDGDNGARLLDTVGTAAQRVTDALTRFGDGVTSAGANGATARIDRLTARQEVAQTRLEDLRKRYIEQFTQMERLVGQLNAQGNSLNASLTALRGNRR
jgi:flagellar hook-associated protein 2